MSKDQSLPPNQSTAVFLDGVSVIYRVPMEKIASIKEFAIKKVMNKLKYRQFHALNNIHVTVKKVKFLVLSAGTAQANRPC